MSFRYRQFIPYLLGGLITVALFQLDWVFWDLKIQDFFIRHRIFAPQGKKLGVTLVLVNNATLNQLGREPNLSDWSLALKNLVPYQPQAVVMTKTLTRWSDDEESISKPLVDWDTSSVDEFKKQVSQLNFYQQTERLFFAGSQDQVYFVAPFDFVKNLSAPKTADNALFAEDGRSRRAFVSYQGQDLGHLQLIRQFKNDVTFNPKGQFEVFDSKQIFIDFVDSKIIDQVSFESLIQADFKPELITGRIIILGEDLGKANRDYLKTPLKFDVPSMPLAEFHAQVFQTMLRDAGIIVLPKLSIFVLVLLLSFVLVYFAFHGDPVWGLISLIGSLFFLLLSNFLLYNFLESLLPLAAALMTLLIVYYVLLPYRLILEQRKTWEAQQKNKLLAQVEELKTNFISMMSHDLKTPIARIQGMLDILINEKNNLSFKQREAIDFIRNSADDLLRVLSAILNYAKIESEGVELHRSHRDINQLLEEVINKHLFLAKLKQIQIIFEAETLFPVLIDADLMRQVFANLIENAIKYSPEGTKVLVSTEEVAGHLLKVQVSDQGIGIAPEELPFIFSKFYRSQQVRSSAIKGSGLGLYLSNYFVKLHQGQLTVESEVNLGTTFTVELPILSQG